MAKKSTSTLKSQIAQATAQGHNITYRIRKDGGLVITSIDNQKYKNKEGNKAIRTITGKQLTAKKQQQLQQAGRVAKLEQQTRQALPSKEKQLITKIRKAEKAKNKSKHKMGGKERLTTARKWNEIRYKYRGRESEVLTNKLIRATGVVYFKTQLDMAFTFLSHGFQDIYEMLSDDNFCMVTEETFQHFQDVVYPLLQDGFHTEDEWEAALEDVKDRGKVVLKSNMVETLSFDEASLKYMSSKGV